MGKTSKKVLEKIKKEEIKPIPKWHFMLKESFIWSLFVLSTILGSVGFGIVLYLLNNNDVLQDKTLVSNFWERIIFGIPFAWILLTLFFILVAYYNFKNTEEGYRFNVARIFLLSLLVSFLLGGILYTTKLSEKLNNLLTDNIPYYTHTMDMRNRIWMRPEDGYLAGKVKSINEKEKILILTDLNGQEWKVNYVDATVRGRVHLIEDEDIKILGKQVSEGVFTAEDIRPWGGMGRRMQESR